MKKYELTNGATVIHEIVGYGKAISTLNDLGFTDFVDLNPPPLDRHSIHHYFTNRLKEEIAYYTPGMSCLFIFKTPRKTAQSAALILKKLDPLMLTIPRIEHQCPRCEKDKCTLSAQPGVFVPDSKLPSILNNMLLLLDMHAKAGDQLVDIKYTCSNCDEQSFFMEGVAVSKYFIDFLSRYNDNKEVNKEPEIQYRSQVEPEVSSEIAAIEEAMRIRAAKYK